MGHEDNILRIYLKGNQVPLDMQEHMEAVSENSEVREIGMQKIEVRGLSNQGEFSGRRHLPGRVCGLVRRCVSRPGNDRD